jgi:hypothetical protein
VLRYLEGPAGKLAGLAAGGLRVFGPAFNDEPQVALRRPGECGSVMLVDRDRTLE